MIVFASLSYFPLSGIVSDFHLQLHLGLVVYAAPDWSQLCSRLVEIVLLSLCPLSGFRLSRLIMLSTLGVFI